MLANRVRQLEDGLADSHSRNSHTPHPLLSEELLQIKRPLERERQDVPQVDEKPETEDTIDSLGSLCVCSAAYFSFSDGIDCAFITQFHLKWRPLYILRPDCKFMGLFIQPSNVGNNVIDNPYPILYSISFR